MRLQDFTGEDYNPQKMRALVRQLELALSALEQRISQISGGGGGSASLSDATPVALGVAAPGNGTEASRWNHVHPMPDASQVGADPAGTASAAIAAHVAAPDPHPVYLLKTDVVPYSISRVEAGQTVTIPRYHNLLITDDGIDVLGTLDLRGALFSVGHNAF